VLYLPDHADLDACQRKGFLGRQVELPEHRYLTPLVRSRRVALRERT